MTTCAPVTLAALTPPNVKAWVVPAPVGNVAVCSPRDVLDAPGPVNVTRIALPPQYAAVSFSPLTVTVVASYPGIVLWYEGVYVTFNAPAWQAATALEPAPKLSEVTERLAAKPYTPEKTRRPIAAAVSARFMSSLLLPLSADDEVDPRDAGSVHVARGEVRTEGRSRARRGSCGLGERGVGGPGPGQRDLVRLGPAMPARGVEAADGDDPDLVSGDRWVVGHRVRRGQYAALTGRDRRRPSPEGRRADAETGGEPVYRAEHHGAHEDRHEEAFHPSDAARHDPLHSVRWNQSRLLRTHGGDP